MKRIQSVPLVIGQFLEAVDQNYAIVGSTTGEACGVGGGGEGGLANTLVCFISVHNSSLIPKPLPDFISQLWRKIGRRPEIIATSRAGNGGLG